MPRRRSNSDRPRSQHDSYFTTCRWCRQRIHMRHMPHGQWLAFSDSMSVHECTQKSQYGSRGGRTKSPSQHAATDDTAPRSSFDSVYGAAERSTLNPLLGRKPHYHAPTSGVLTKFNFLEKLLLWLVAAFVVYKLVGH